MVYTGLSGNELYCLAKIGLQPGDLIIGNSVFSLGILGGIRSGFKGMIGGEIHDYTDIINEGRRLSYKRLLKEVNERGALGATGVTSELVVHPGNIEFLSIASSLHSPNEGQHEPFTTSSNGQELYCQMDAGYTPKKFVFGNVAYSVGLAQGFMGGLRTVARGEIREYTDIFNATRNLALERIVREAQSIGANCVVGIETTILPFQGVGVQEMLMLGTASNCQFIEYGNAEAAVGDVDNVVTSDLTCQELWNITSMGYVPYKLVLGTSVYSLGFVGSVTSVIKGLAKGEINELTTLIYDAREESIGKIQQEAEALGADDVIGIKTYVYSLGSGLIEFLAIGTAVKKVGASVRTRSEQLPPQAVMPDKDTFYNTAETEFGVNLNSPNR
ncbi:MAG: heavy metal-binding domain-containing protein [bacterium]